LRQRPLDEATLPADQRQVWSMLAEGVLPLASLFADPRAAYFRRMELAQLVDRGAVVVSGFTPTDAAHVLGHQADWSTEAAQLGAELWARHLSDITGDGVNPSPQPPPLAGEGERGSSPCVWEELGGGVAQEFCRRVVRQVVVQAGRALVTAALAEAHGLRLDDRDAVQRLLIDQPLGATPPPHPVLDTSLTLRRPIVAIGAPVATYYPTVSERLHTRLCIPPHAGIANAVGAVAGGVVQTVRVQIKMLDGEQGFRVHLPTGIHDFANLQEASEFALCEAQQAAEAMAREAGAVDVQAQSYRHDHIARIRKEDVFEDMYIDTEVTAIAFGRPRLAER
jgi:N-methylhydantoinase A/oxoprolinase/acetone carboxylase beta subunit